MRNWTIINNDDDTNYKEKKLLLLLISQYEDQKYNLPDVDPIDFIKIRLDVFGYNLVKLAAEYSDKCTISKVMNYKQPLTLTMIRKFSNLLHIPADILIKEYDIQQ